MDNNYTYTNHSFEDNIKYIYFSQYRYFRIEIQNLGENLHWEHPQMKRQAWLHGSNLASVVYLKKRNSQPILLKLKHQTK
jgi:hypothetical protein